MVQRSSINKNKFQIADAHKLWAEKIVCETIHFIITALPPNFFGAQKFLHYSRIYHVALKCKCL